MKSEVQILIVSDRDEETSKLKLYLNKHKVNNKVRITNHNNYNKFTYDNNLIDLFVIDEYCCNEHTFLKNFKKAITFDEITDCIYSYLSEELANVHKIKRKILCVKELNKHGIPSHLAGYKFMLYILMCDEEKRKIYDLVAKKYSVDSKKVERSIRYAIEVGWTRINQQEIENTFGNSIHLFKNKPTNKQFIEAILNNINS